MNIDFSKIPDRCSHVKLDIGLSYNVSVMVRQRRRFISIWI